MFNRRTVFVVGTFVLVLGGVVGLVLTYPFSYTDRTIPYDGTVPVDETDSYQIEGELVFENGLSIEYEGAMDTGGEAYFSGQWDGGEYREKQYSPNNSTVYSKLRVENESDADRIDVEDDAEVVERYEDDGTYAVVTKREDIDGTHPVVDEHRSLNQLLATVAVRNDYERVGSEASNGVDFHVYEPRATWLGSSNDSYYLSNASGAAYVHGDTGKLHRVDISFDVAVVSTYVEYYTNPDEAETVSIAYEHEETDVDIDHPNWASG